MTNGRPQAAGLGTAVICAAGCWVGADIRRTTMIVSNETQALSDSLIGGAEAAGRRGKAGRWAAVGRLMATLVGVLAGAHIDGCAVTTVSTGALEGCCRAAADSICDSLTDRRAHVPPQGTPRRFHRPQPLPRKGRLVGVVHLPAGPRGGALPHLCFGGGSRLATGCAWVEDNLARAGDSSPPCSCHPAPVSRGREASP